MLKFHDTTGGLHSLFERAHTYVEDISTAPTPQVNIIDGGAVFFVEAALPGVFAENVTIETKGALLTISGKSRMAEQEEEKNAYLRHEMHTSSFRREIPLPAGVEGEKASALFENGLLTLTLPKADVADEKTYKIDIHKPV